MTLRTMAKILGISPAYLSLLINGKRKWRGDLEERYQTLVNTFVNNKNRVGEEKVVPRKGLEPPLSYKKRILSSLLSGLKGSSQYLYVQKFGHKSTF